MTDAIQLAALTAAQKLLGLQFHRIVGEPDAADCEQTLDDWTDLFAVILPLFREMGAHARSELGIDVSDAIDFMSDLQGDLIDAFHKKANEFAEFEHERAVDLRGYDRAVRLGVD